MQMERFVMAGFPLLNYIFSQGFLPQAQVKKKFLVTLSFQNKS